MICKIPTLPRKKLSVCTEIQKYTNSTENITIEKSLLAVAPASLLNNKTLIHFTFKSPSFVSNRRYGLLNVVVTALNFVKR